MKLTPAQIESLIAGLKRTREEELNCNECLAHLAEFAELELNNVTIPEALLLVRQHLELCAECQEEYEVLLALLKDV